MEHRAGVWLDWRHWTRSVQHPRSPVGHQRSDSAISHATRPREGIHTQTHTSLLYRVWFLKWCFQDNRHTQSHCVGFPYSVSHIFHFYLSDHCCRLSVCLVFSNACLCLSTSSLVSPSTLSHHTPHLHLQPFSASHPDHFDQFCFFLRVNLY